MGLSLTGCLLRAEARSSVFILCQQSGAGSLFNMPLPLVDPIGPVHLGISSNPAETKI